MNRELVLGLVGTAVFAVALGAGALMGDSMRDQGGGELIVPDVVGAPIPVLPGEQIPAGEEFTDPIGDVGFVETEIEGEFVSLGSGEAGVEAPRGVFARPDAGDDGTEPDEGSEDGGSTDLEDRSVPWEVTPFEFEYEELVLPEASHGLLRWLDFCAETPGAASCPDGVGGTVLAPYDDTLAVGDFRLHEALDTIGRLWWQCEVSTEVGEAESIVAVSASHPARLEIEYRPVDGTLPARSTVVDYTDPEGDAFRDFVDRVERGEFDWVSHCVVIQAGSIPRSYELNVRATSFTGETAEAVYTFESSDLRDRPPITMDPNGDYQTVVAVPVTSEPLQQTRVVLLPPGEAASCSDDMLGRSILPTPPGHESSFYVGRLRYPSDVLESSDYRYDPAFDAADYWTLNLQEGTRYLMCVWWLESDGLRSFDPASSAIAEREERSLNTPDRLSATMRIVYVRGPSDRRLAAESIVIRSSCGSSVYRSARIPLTEMEPSQVDLSRIPLCDYGGFFQPTHTSIEARFSDGVTKTFLIRTPNTGRPRTKQVNLDLTREGGSGLCGGSFGECDPPTSTISGPLVGVRVDFVEGASNGRRGWVLGLPAEFEATPAPPEDLPTEIRIDERASGVVSPSAGLEVVRDRLSVTAAFDRPVHLRATIAGDLDEQCFSGEPPRFESTGMDQTHTFEIGNLCADTTYEVDLEATDAVGTTTRFTYSPTAEGTPYWPGRGTTDGYRVSVSIDIPDESDFARGHTRVLDVVVDGRRFNLIGDNRCLGQETGPHEMVWGDAVEIEVHARVDVGTGLLFEDYYCDFSVPYEGSVVARFTIEELMTLSPETVTQEFHLVVPMTSTRSGLPLALGVFFDVRFR